MLNTTDVPKHQYHLGDFKNQYHLGDLSLYADG